MKVAHLSDGIMSDVGRNAGKRCNKCVNVDDKYVVMHCNGGSLIVYDFDMFDVLSHWTWTLNSSMYALNSANVYMHRYIMDADSNPDSDLSIDHVNWIKTDNRKANLRFATQSEQNSNRATRHDKEPANAELRAHGILELPSGIRRDSTMGRYTCADHPACRGQGKRFNGTRCKDASEIARFKDCLEIYVENLSESPEHARQADIADTRRRLATEYNDIVRAAVAFDPTLLSSADSVTSALVEVADDDLSFARRLLRSLSDVVIVRGCPNLTHEDVEIPSLGAVARLKGGTVTLMDKNVYSKLRGENWEVGEGSPPRLNKVALSTVVWNIAGRAPPPPGSVVVPISRVGYDVRLENLEVIVGRQAYRVVPGDHLFPEGVSWTGQDRFLPKGLTINRSKVMLSAAAGVSQNWAKSINPLDRLNSTTRHIREAYSFLRESHGEAEFDASNAKYQRLLGEYVDVQRDLS